jgi:hypothetical protein
VTHENPPQSGPQLHFSKTTENSENFCEELHFPVNKITGPIFKGDLVSSTWYRAATTRGTTFTRPPSDFLWDWEDKDCDAKSISKIPIPLHSKYVKGIKKSVETVLDT